MGKDSKRWKIVLGMVVLMVGLIAAGIWGWQKFSVKPVEKSQPVSVKAAEPNGLQLYINPAGRYSIQYPSIVTTGVSVSEDHLYFPEKGDSKHAIHFFIESSNGQQVTDWLQNEATKSGFIVNSKTLALNKINSDSDYQWFLVGETGSVSFKPNLNIGWIGVYKDKLILVANTTSLGKQTLEKVVTTFRYF